MKTLILGAIHNYEYSDIEPWLVSLKKSGYTGDIGLLCFDIKFKTLEALKNKGVKIFYNKIDAENNAVYNDDDIMTRRFLFAHYVIKDSDYESILFTDVKDVIFQSDPFRMIIPNKICVGSENIPYMYEYWNRTNMQQSFGYEAYGYVQNNIVNCAGVIGGPREILSELFLNIWLMCKGLDSRIVGGGGPDQAALNLLLSFSYLKERLKIFHGEENWVCHAGTTDDAIFDAVSHSNMSSMFKDENNYKLLSTVRNRKRPILKNDLLCNADGNAYAIVHQYDRIKSWKHLSEKYRE